MAEIPVDFTAADYQAIKADLLRRAEALLPEWTSRSEADFGVVMAELWAHAADLNNYAIDRLLNESFLPTASTLQSVLRLADLLGYIPHGAVAATGTITLQTDADGPAVTIPVGTAFSSDYVESTDGTLRFEATQVTVIPAAGGTAVVSVAEGRSVTKLTIGSSNGRESQRFPIPHQGVIDGTVQVYVQGPHADLEWVAVPRLIYSASSDLVFSVRPDAFGGVIISFGDGVNGSIPPLGAAIYASYRHGSGAAGNLAPGKVSAIAAQIDGVTIATTSTGIPQSSAMIGGGGAEGIEEIRANASQVYAAQARAVTVADYAKISLEVPGVTAANAISSVSSSVVVYIAGPGRSSPSVDLVTAVEDHLLTASAAGVRVTVGGPTLIGVNYGTVSNPLRLTVAPTWRRLQVETQVKTTLTAITNAPSFGSRVSVGGVYAALIAIPGVINVTLPVMARADAAQTGVADVLLAPYELPVIGTINISSVGGVG